MLAEPKKFAFIDALRGLAILAVILVHSGGAVSAGTPWIQTVMASGARGVQLFYIASALTLCMSWQARAKSERSPARNFYLRRLFRIVPMFYIAIAAYLALYGLSPRYYAPNGIRWYYVPLTAGFLNGFHPETITSVVPGGWSIVVEMTFYLALPLLIRLTRSIGALLVLCLVCLVAARVGASATYAFYGDAYPPNQLYLVDALAELNFFSQLPVFIFGMIAWWLLRHRQAWRSGIVTGAIVFASWLIVMKWLAGMSVTRVLSMPIAMGALFAIGALLLERWPVTVLVNRVTTTIGKFSFSMYLSHFAVLDAFAAMKISQSFTAGDATALLHYALVVAATIAISAVTYYSIERPAIAAGRRLIDRLESSGAIRAAASSPA